MLELAAWQVVDFACSRAYIQVDDLLPALKRDRPTGRPEAAPCADGPSVQCQAVTLELSPRRSALAKAPETVSARL